MLLLTQVSFQNTENVDETNKSREIHDRWPSEGTGGQCCLANSIAHEPCVSSLMMSNEKFTCWDAVYAPRSQFNQRFQQTAF